MPYVNVKITREGGTTRAQKAAIVKGVSELLRDVLGKPLAATFVVINEVELEDWGVGGLLVEDYRKQEGSDEGLKPRDARQLRFQPGHREIDKGAHLRHRQAALRRQQMHRQGRRRWIDQHIHQLSIAAPHRPPDTRKRGSARGLRPRRPPRPRPCSPPAAARY